MAKFIFEIDPAELMCVIAEAGMDMKRPAGSTAVQALAIIKNTEPEMFAALGRQAEAVARYFTSVIAADTTARVS